VGSGVNMSRADFCYMRLLLEVRIRKRFANCVLFGQVRRETWRAFASDSGIALFRRFEIMRYWRVTGGVTFEQMISNFDGNWLHQNDWSYNCIAQALCDGIVEAVATEELA